MSDYTTSIGLDVHARSIKGCAFDPRTGEVEFRSFPYDPSAVAAWVLSFESPKAVYESGVTGFHLCRELRALGVDCAVGAVSKMMRPAGDRGRKTDRRDAQFLAKARTRLFELVERSGILVFASHSDEFLADLCDTAIWLEHGTIREHGPLREVLTHYKGRDVLAEMGR